MNDLRILTGKKYIIPSYPAYEGRRVDEGDNKKSSPPTSLVSSKTELCDIMTRCGSDKGNGHHNYTILYHQLFSSVRELPINLFELGLGSVNPSIPSNMGVNGTPCASIKGWLQYFSLANIYGGDIDNSLFNIVKDERFHPYYVNQIDLNSIRELWSKIPSQTIIIDDGVHEFNYNLTFFEGSISHLQKGGMYFIESIIKEDADKWKEYFSRCTDKYTANIVELPNEKNKVDNRLLMVQVK